MKRPTIAITTSYTSDEFIRMRPTYFNAVWAAGGIPCYLAHTTDEERLAQYAADFDGFIFAGGDDVDPARYGEQISYDSVEITAERDAFELALFRHVVATGKPIFGICRGIQLINVAMGGSLYQHIDGHSRPWFGGDPYHIVRLTSDTPLSHAAEGAATIRVNSFHHQAIKALAPGLRAIATSDDGLCEAVCAPDHPFLVAVQWHPEAMAAKDETARRLFEIFVERA